MIAVKLHHAEPLRVHDLVAKDRRTPRQRGVLFEQGREALAIEYVVSENQTYRGVADKPFTDNERLRQTFWPGLHRIGQVHPELTTVAQYPVKGRLVLWRGNNENVLNTRQHKYRQRVVNHGLVIDGEQLLAHAQRDGVKTRALASCKYDPLHARRTCGREIGWPMRAKRYSPVSVCCHHAVFSKYHCTVFRRPDSKVSWGRQPSARSILVASVA